MTIAVNTRIIDYNNRCMPKRTRQDKEAAAARRKIRLLRELSIHDQTPQTRPKIITSKVTKNTQVVERALDGHESLRSYFKADLRKSLFLIALIIALEFVIYFASINKYLKF